MEEQEARFIFVIAPQKRNCKYDTYYSGKIDEKLNKFREKGEGEEEEEADIFETTRFDAAGVVTIARRLGLFYYTSKFIVRGIFGRPRPTVKCDDCTAQFILYKTHNTFSPVAARTAA